MATTTRKRKHNLAPLTVTSVRRRKFAVALLEGKSAAQAAREAGYRYNPGRRPERDEDLQQWMTELGKEYNVTPRRIMEKVSQGLEAVATKVSPKGLAFEVDDFFVRHRYVETAIKLMGMEPPTKTQIQNTGGVVLRVTPSISDNPHEVFDGPRR